MRVKKRWNQNSRERSLEQMANAVSAVVWKAAAQVVLNLENDNFETTTQAQRVDLVEEVLGLRGDMVDVEAHGSVW